MARRCSIFKQQPRCVWRCAICSALPNSQRRANGDTVSLRSMQRILSIAFIARAFLSQSSFVFSRPISPYRRSALSCVRLLRLWTALTVVQRTGVSQNLSPPPSNHHRLHTVLLRNLVERLHPAHRLQAHLPLKLRTVGLASLLRLTHSRHPFSDDSLKQGPKFGVHYTLRRCLRLLCWLPCMDGCAMWVSIPCIVPVMAASIPPVFPLASRTFKH